MLSSTALKICREKVYTKNKEMNGMKSWKGEHESRNVVGVVIGGVLKEDFLFPQIQTLNKYKST